MIVGVVIVAAGRGARMGGPGPKTLMPLGTSTILTRAVGVFASHPRIGPMTVVASAVDAARAALGALSSRVTLVPGGPERQDSVRLGLEALGEVSIVLVHDAARPLVEAPLIDAVIEGAARHGAAVPALAPSDTVKQVGADGAVERTIPREGIRLAQTPQGFRIDVLRSAYERAARDGFLGTDDAQLVERAGGKVVLVEGSPRNIKITRPSDLRLAEALLAQGRDPNERVED
jgi:2-C-methyl-D-erythritol 4-phosphate cytidylyltransferase